MKNTILFLVAMVPMALFAQVTAERQVIASGGWESNTGTLQASSTIGETVVATATSGTLILTQGFQQPTTSDSIIGIEDVAAGLSLTAYPNPTMGSVTLDMTVEKQLSMNIAVYDVNGKQVLTTQQWNVTGSMKKPVDFSSLAAGQYFINLSTTDGRLNKSIKIQKVN